jgi:hypothetical protein
MDDDQRKADQEALSLWVETSGCAGTCKHCVASGHPYPSTPLRSLERVLEEADRFCRAEGLKLNACPIHDVLTHEDALKVMQLFSHYCPKVFEPLTTPGPLLAMRSDWEEILGGAKQLGTTVIWFALHGIGEVHDRAVGRNGAFAETVVAIGRATQVGLGCGANVFFSVENVQQVPEMVGFCRVHLGQVWYGIAGYVPTPRLREYERSRPTLAQLLPFAEMVTEAAGSWTGIWPELEKHTEAWYVQQALSTGQSEEAWTDSTIPGEINLLCRGNLDLHTGYQGMPGPLHGNLLDGDAQAAFRRAAAVGHLSVEQVCFAGRRFPAVPELAAGWGDAKGQKLHTSGKSVYLGWLDNWYGGLAKKLTRGSK